MDEQPPVSSTPGSASGPAAYSQPGPIDFLHFRQKHRIDHMDDPVLAGKVI